MEDLDYSQIDKVIGFVKLQQNKIHADVHVIGYIDIKNWKPKYLSCDETKQIFPPKGQIFAPNFGIKNVRIW